MSFPSPEADSARADYFARRGLAEELQADLAQGAAEADSDSVRWPLIAVGLIPSSLKETRRTTVGLRLRRPTCSRAPSGALVTTLCAVDSAGVLAEHNAT